MNVPIYQPMNNAASNFERLTIDFTLKLKSAISNFLLNKLFKRKWVLPVNLEISFPLFVNFVPNSPILLWWPFLPIAMIVFMVWIFSKGTWNAFHHNSQLFEGGECDLIWIFWFEKPRVLWKVHEFESLVEAADQKSLLLGYCYFDFGSNSKRKLRILGRHFFMRRNEWTNWKQQEMIFTMNALG
jgi:hypothetical protein